MRNRDFLDLQRVCGEHERMREIIIKEVEALTECTRCGHRGFKHLGGCLYNDEAGSQGTIGETKKRKYVILITGSRGWKNKGHIKFRLKDFIKESGWKPEEVMVIHGASGKSFDVGAERLAETAAAELGVEVEAIPAAWPEEGSKNFEQLKTEAANERWKKMLDKHPKVVLVFHNNFEKNSIVSKSLVRKAMRVNIPCYLYVEGYKEAVFIDPKMTNFKK